MHDNHDPQQHAARLRAVLDAALDAVVIADSLGTVVEFNPAACRTFGYARDEAIGRELVDLIVPPTLRKAHRTGFARYIATEESRLLDQRVETTGMRRDGSELPIELTITRIAMAGPPMFAAYLRDLTETRQAQADLRESRLRVVDAAARERQRLERDLHDGAQQQLISLGLILARARGAGPERMPALIDDAIARLESAAAELRNLARGIHPSSLTQYGLAAALTDVAGRSPLDITVGGLPDRRYPAGVEATAYFVVSESLTNAARYAAAARVRVEVVDDGHALAVIVSDDGPGGASAGGGTGLLGLADRIALFDGVFEVDSVAGVGTTVRASIPYPRVG